MTKPKIGILGTGNVGQILGAGLAQAGYEVKMGSRTPQKVKDWVSKNGPRASAGTFEEAVRFGDVLVFAVKGDAAEAVIKEAGAAHFQGKVVVDTTNALAFTAPNAPPGLFVSGNDSLGERIQRWLPGAKVVKAWNWIGSPAMVNPKYPEGDPEFFHAGNDAAAKKQVTVLAQDLGWKRFFDLGGIEMSRYLEPLAMVYILHGFQTNNWSCAFKFVGT